MCLDPSHRWKSADKIAWLRTRGLHSVPNSIKADIGDLVYNGPKRNALDESAALAPPPGRFVFNTGGRATTHHLDYKYCRCLVGQIGNLRRCPVGEIGNAPAKPGASLLQDPIPFCYNDYAMLIYEGLGHGPKWPHRVLW